MTTIYDRLKVEVGFGARLDAELADEDWTDITGWVRWPAGITATSGRTASQLHAITAGSSTLILDNLDGRFNPHNPDGPYYGELLPRVPVRISMIAAGGEVRSRWRGWVDGGWPQGWADVDSTVTLKLLDAAGYLAQAETEQAAFDDLIRRGPAPTAWLRPGPTGWVDAVSGKGWSHSTKLEPADSVIDGHPESWACLEPQGAGVVNDADLLIDPEGHAFPDLDAGWGFAATFRVAGYEKVNTGGTDLIYLWDGTGADGNAHGFVVQVISPARIIGATDWTVVVAARGDTTAVAWTLADADVSVDFFDGGVHQVAFVCWNPGLILGRLWIDGRPVDPDLVAGAGWAGAPALPIRVADTTRLVTNPVEGVEWGDLLYWAPEPGRSAELVDTVSGLWDAARIAWAGDSMPQRLAKVVDSAGWALVGDLGEAGVTTRQGFRGGSALTLAQTIENTEQGRIWVDREGRIQFRPRSWAWTEPRAVTVQAVFTDDPDDLDLESPTGPWPYRADALRITDDDSQLCNSAQVTSAHGRMQTVEDPTSIARYGRRSRHISGLLHPTDAQSRSIAEWLVKAGAEPRLRVEQLSIDADEHPALYEWATKVEEGDLIEVRRTPPGSSSPIVVRAHVAGLAHAIGPWGWRLTLHLDSSRAQTGWFVWGTSEWGGADGWAF